MSEKLYKERYFKAIREVVREMEADPLIKEHRRQGTYKQLIVDLLKASPELWDTYFVEACDAAYNELKNEEQSSP